MIRERADHHAPRRRKVGHALEPVGRARGRRQEQECEGDREQDSERRQDRRESPAVDPLAHEGALGHEGHFLLVAAPLRAGEHLGWPVPDAARRRGPAVHRDHALAPRTRTRRQFAARARRAGVIIGATRRCWPSRRRPRGRGGKRAPGRAWPRVYLIRGARRSGPVRGVGSCAPGVTLPLAGPLPALLRCQRRPPPAPRAALSAPESRTASRPQMSTV